MHGIFNGPAGIPGTDFWNQLRVTGSPRASIIAAISERALLFPLALLLIIPPLSLSLSFRHSRFFLLLFLLPAFTPSFSPFLPFFQGGTFPTTVRIVQLIGGKMRSEPRDRFPLCWSERIAGRRRFEKFHFEAVIAPLEIWRPGELLRERLHSFAFTREGNYDLFFPLLPPFPPGIE